MGMSNFKRSLNYQSQEELRINSLKGFQGMRNLTPAQLRRMRKAHNKRRGSLQSLAAAGLKHLDATINERLDWNVTPCPVCGLTGDPKTNPCMTKSGAVASRTHKGRVS